MPTHATHTQYRWLVALVSAVATAAGCQGEIETRDKYEGQAELFVRWAPPDDPALLGDDLVYELAALPAQGQTAAAPWPGSYWPTYQDSINYRWAGSSTVSAAAKYGRAFGVPDVERKVSEAYGILAHPERRSCSSDWQCNTRNDEVCGKRVGERSGRCIPRWWGSCHAWAPAAILEAEPAAPVTLNGVTFGVNDVKALLTIAHDRTQYKYLSLRCYDSDSRREIRYDEFGRPTGDDVECRDTNPGTFHVVLANYVGLQQRSFIEDRVFDAQVWNQPIHGYEVLRQQQVSASQANALVGASGSTYLFNADATMFFHMQLRVRWIREAAANTGTDRPLAASVESYTGTDTYDYLLELDRAGKIIGGEWLEQSKRNHPDFLWLPTGVASTTAAGGAISYADVKQLADLSTSGGGEPPPPPPPQPPAPDEQLDVSGAVRRGEGADYHLAVHAGVPVEIRTTAPNDIDLFIRLDAEPTTAAYDARSIGWTGDELIRYDPPRDGTLHILVYGYEASTYRLTAGPR